MRTPGISSLLVAIVAATVAISSEAQEQQRPRGTITETYAADKSGKREMRLRLTLPRDSDGEVPVKGVMAICSYSDQGAGDALGGSRHFSYLVEFAQRHQLALVAFGKPVGGWNRTVNSSDLSGHEAAEQSRKLDDSARLWSRSVRSLASKYDLPTKGWLLHGICGGAQYAHRLALREPDLFRAVHVHYGGSYDEPTSRGKDILWLVTTRADEPAYMAAQKFYRLCRERDYRIILKGFRSPVRGGLDEGGNAPGVSDLAKNELSLRFFEFALSSPYRPAEMTAAYIADYVNELVMPADAASWIPKEQAIWLPNREIAEAWGPISE